MTGRNASLFAINVIFVTLNMTSSIKNKERDNDLKEKYQDRDTNEALSHLQHENKIKNHARTCNVYLLLHSSASGGRNMCHNGFGHVSHVVGM